MNHETEKRFPGLTGPLEVDTETRGALERQLAEVDAELLELPEAGDPSLRAHRLVEKGRVLNRLERGEEAWGVAREAFDMFVGLENWEGAVEASDVLFESDQEASLEALGQGIWLAVTYPIDPEISAIMLRHLVEESPPGGDTAAVAAATAYYLACTRGQGKAGEGLRDFTAAQMAEVAKAHSMVDSQAEFGFWVDRLGLNNPEHFLPHLGQALEKLVRGNWWYDRDALRARLPVQ